ncbi:MAG: preprotein translocase subunit YajC [Rhodospirillales bacterium]|jgi:preprotein translocase subunit YajC|nr:preprotein translocase subunit YajC [Rhodospirillales bacterium]
MFISPAYAQAGGLGGGGFEAFLPLILIFVVFYFLLIRPQQKKAKVHREMLGAIRRGDKVVTNGGIVGTVTKVIDEAELMVEIADGIRVRVQRGMIASVRTKGEPVKDATKSGGGAGESQEGPVAKLKGLLGGKGK